MALRVSGKNLDIGEALRAHVQARIDSTVAKYGAGPIVGHVIIEPEGSGFRTDCTLHLNSGATLQADAKAREPYDSFNRAADKIERRVRRHRKRLSDHHVILAAEELAPEEQTAGRKRGDGINAVVVDSAPRSLEADEKAKNPTVIAEPSSAFKKMTVSNAVMELDLTNAPVIIFRHAADGRTNIVYRRPDGNIGWIDPSRP
jgi:ribosomal subunit interface protein